MVNQGQKKEFDINQLRGWRRSQLKLLKEFVIKPLVSQTILSGASGLKAGSNALGGKMTTLVKKDLIIKAGRDDDGSWLWQLNDEKIDKILLEHFLKKMGI